MSACTHGRFDRHRRRRRRSASASVAARCRSRPATAMCAHSCGAERANVRAGEVARADHGDRAVLREIARCEHRAGGGARAVVRYSPSRTASGVPSAGSKQQTSAWWLGRSVLSGKWRDELRGQRAGRGQIRRHREQHARLSVVAATRGGTLHRPADRSRIAASSASTRAVGVEQSLDVGCAQDEHVRQTAQRPARGRGGASGWPRTCRPCASSSPRMTRRTAGPRAAGERQVDVEGQADRELGALGGVAAGRTRPSAPARSRLSGGGAWV